MLQPRIPDGGGRGGICGAIGSLDNLLHPAIQNGCVIQEPSLLPRGSQLYFSQLRDSSLPPPDLPEGTDREDGFLAHLGTRYFIRWDPDPSPEPNTNKSEKL